MKPSDTDPFVLLHFTLERREDGHPTQRTATRGTFGAIERAFTVAREEAGRELLWRRAQRPAPTVELLDTEWGYDLRQDCTVVSRYWVHDRAPAALNV